MLTVKNLDVSTKNGVAILNNISFELLEGRTMCILGQSGSGKSVLAYSIMDILHRNLTATSGEIILDDTVLTELSAIERRKRLGIDISLIMQNPLTALDPTVKVGKQIAECIKIHNKKIDKNILKERVIKLLKDVNLTEDIYNKYPYQISGGMAQKVVIAIAMANRPKLIIADEPITALDRNNTYDILNILKDKKENNTQSMIYISHDIASVEFMADDIIVLYKGFIVEILTKDEFINKPLHPYTVDLKNSVIKGTYSENKIESIYESNTKVEKGCIYQNHCKMKTDACLSEIPLNKVDNGYVRCINV